ncbi:hypothetical protein Poly24_21190 [Rosistilla carotiformis]|uniref:Uncharacterized protein n=1 Tax=Rosistilla carotiformis TaxID=2528017 RepID=A0A518JSA1_9BACT|nr:hypothetical protein [Rosistilla carotiformis]QDV68410.1 hypothetical protein Poly24_21190 [Rosistilla carotiformis]
MTADETPADDSPQPTRLSDDRAESESVDRQRSAERFVLLLATVGPASLAALSFGSQLVNEYTIQNVWIGLLSYFLSGIQFFYYLIVPIWIAWRYPVLGRQGWPVIGYLLLGLIACEVPTLLQLYNVREFLEFQYSQIAVLQVGWDLMRFILAIGGFVLLRRITGYCLVDAGLPQLPVKQPITIAELFGWIGLVAVVMAIARPLNRVYQSLQLGTSAAVAPTLLVVLVTTVLSAAVLWGTILFLIWMRERRVWIRLVLGVCVYAALMVVNLAIYQMISSNPFPVAVGAELVPRLVLAVSQVVGCMLSLWVLRRMGLQFVRLSPRGDRSDEAIAETT